MSSNFLSLSLFWQQELKIHCLVFLTYFHKNLNPNTIEYILEKDLILNYVFSFGNTLCKLTTADLFQFQWKIFLVAYIWACTLHVVFCLGAWKVEFLYVREEGQEEGRGGSFTDMVCVSPFLEMKKCFGLSEADPDWVGRHCCKTQDLYLHFPAGLLVSGVLIFKL